MSQTLFLLYRPEPAKPMLKTKSVGAHSICARGSLPYRKRARADMESAPTFFVAGREGRVFPCCVCRGDHWSPANLPPQRIFRDSFLVRQAGTGEQCSPLQEFSPVWARNIPARRTVLSPTACGRSPLAEGAKSGRCPAWSFLPLSKTKSVGAHSICARGGLSCRKRARADMESAPTFFVAGGGGAFLPVVRASGFISAFALSKTILCGILFLYKSTGKPGANRRRKAIGAHRVSQLPTRNCCFTAAGSFASFWGQELTRVKTQRYTGGTKQGIYDALLFSAARGYCLIQSDSAFRHGSAMS